MLKNIGIAAGFLLIGLGVFSAIALDVSEHRYHGPDSTDMVEAHGLRPYPNHGYDILVPGDTSNAEYYVGAIYADPHNNIYFIRHGDPSNRILIHCGNPCGCGSITGYPAMVVCPDQEVTQ